MVIGGLAEPLDGLLLAFRGLAWPSTALGRSSWSRDFGRFPGVAERVGAAGRSTDGIDDLALGFITQQRWSGLAGALSRTPQEAARMMVWYQVPSRDPELQVAVGWEPLLGSFVARVAGVPTGALLDPDHPTVAWFGSRHGELQTVQDLQDAIDQYALLGSDLRMMLEADRTGRPDRPPAGPGPLPPARPHLAHGAPEAPSSDALIGRGLLALAVLVGILVVVLIFALIAVRTGAGNR